MLYAKIGEFDKLYGIATKQDSTIRDLQDKIEQLSITDGISPEYREILDSLEKQSAKDKELLSDYETELTNCKELTDTLKSDIIALKAKPKRDAYGRPIGSRVYKPSVNSDIPLKEIPKRALIQAIYYIECSNLNLKKVTFKQIVATLGYEPGIVNCRHLGSLLSSMHFKVKGSRDGMLLLLDHNRNRKKLNALYKKHCED
jgi:hypothetical protein